MTTADRTTHLLARVLQLLPVGWAATAPVGELRTMTRIAADLIRHARDLQLLDEEGLAATAALLDLAGQGHGTTRAPYRAQLLDALGSVVDTLAYRTAARTKAT